jgi:hypothetical protein
MLYVEEAPLEKSAPVLRDYLKRVPIARPYFDVTPDPPLQDFQTEAARHPVLRLTTERPDPSPDRRRWFRARPPFLGLGCEGSCVVLGCQP